MFHSIVLQLNGDGSKMLQQWKKIVLEGKLKMDCPAGEMNKQNIICPSSRRVLPAFLPVGISFVRSPASPKSRTD
jgi:hypothetical protein